MDYRPDIHYKSFGRKQVNKIVTRVKLEPSSICALHAGLDEATQKFLHSHYEDAADPPYKLKKALKAVAKWTERLLQAGGAKDGNSLVVPMESGSSLYQGNDFRVLDTIIRQVKALADSANESTQAKLAGNLLKALGTEDGNSSAIPIELGSSLCHGIGSEFRDLDSINGRLMALKDAAVKESAKIQVADKECKNRHRGRLALANLVNDLTELFGYQFGGNIVLIRNYDTQEAYGPLMRFVVRTLGSIRKNLSNKVRKSDPKIKQTLSISKEAVSKYIEKSAALQAARQMRRNPGHKP